MLWGAAWIWGPEAALGQSSATAVPMGRVVGWGSDAFGQIDVPADLTNAIDIKAGIEHSLALRADHTVAVWGAGEYDQTNVPPGLSDVIAISTRGYHNLALKSDGTVVAWGLDNDLQCEVPPGLSDVTAVAAGGNHSLALKRDGTVVAWGWDAYGQIDVPAGLSGVVAIAAGSRHSMALKSDHTVVVWGNSGYNTDVPAGLSNVVAISAGRFYNLALKADGTVVAWGDDSDGQTDVPADWSNIVEIAAGGFHNLALRANGQATGFGLDDAGQADIPPQVTNVLALAAGTSHSLAIVFPMTYDPSGAHVGLRITSPAPNSRLRMQAKAEGMAQSRDGVYAVFYQLNGGAWTSAGSSDRFAHWSAALSPMTGTNLLSVYAVDDVGYVSATNSVSFTYKATGTGTLTVVLSGSGRVSPNWTKPAHLRLGKTYHLRAIPARGWSFYQWSGDANSPSPKLRFVMQSNLMLTATFVPQRYAAITGTFTGLFYGYTKDKELDAGNSGALTLTLTPDGSYSGRISMLQGATSISGHLHLDANDTNLVVVPLATKGYRLPELSGSIQIVLTNPAQMLTGTLQQVSEGGATAFTRVASFEGLMVRPGIPNPDQEIYNFGLTPQEATGGPVGGSSGRLKLQPNGAASLSLKLADQEATASVGTFETVGGFVPFFAPLYAKHGLASGWLQLTAHSLRSSNVVWFKAATPSKAYPEGFIQTLQGAGGLYTPAK